MNRCGNVDTDNGFTFTLVMLRSCICIDAVDLAKKTRLMDSKDCFGHEYFLVIGVVWFVWMVEGMGEVIVHSV